jgi:hypothetical protein
MWEIFTDKLQKREATSLSVIGPERDLWHSEQLQESETTTTLWPAKPRYMVMRQKLPHLELLVSNLKFTVWTSRKFVEIPDTSPPPVKPTTNHYTTGKGVLRT